MGAASVQRGIRVPRSLLPLGVALAGVEGLVGVGCCRSFGVAVLGSLGVAGEASATATLWVFGPPASSAPQRRRLQRCYEACVVLYRNQPAVVVGDLRRMGALAIGFWLEGGRSRWRSFFGDVGRRSWIWRHGVVRGLPRSTRHKGKGVAVRGGRLHRSTKLLEGDGALQARASSGDRIGCFGLWDLFVILLFLLGSFQHFHQDMCPFSFFPGFSAGVCCNLASV